MVHPGTAVPLASLTTLRLGGPARALVTATSADALVTALRDARESSEPVLLIGGGSNLVVADAGWPGVAVQVASTGTWTRRGDAGSVVRTVEAGEDWDAVVAAAVADGLGGIECLAGIPGRTGAVPVQNVGAYGVEIAQVLVDADLYDRRTGAVTAHVPASELGLAYRTSVLKGRDAAVVLRARFALTADGRSAPIRYAELARALGVAPETRVPVAAAREAVLALRRGKGMVLDPDDHDTWSVGSFFTNPVVDAARAPSDAPRWPAADGRVKLAAAWLIERAGFGRGFGGPHVALSSRHVLALTHRGGGTTAELIGLAAQIRDGVERAFGIRLEPEPVLVGVSV